MTVKVAFVLLMLYHARVGLTPSMHGEVDQLQRHTLFYYNTSISVQRLQIVHAISTESYSFKVIMQLCEIGQILYDMPMKRGGCAISPFGAQHCHLPCKYLESPYQQLAPARNCVACGPATSYSQTPIIINHCNNRRHVLHRSRYHCPNYHLPPTEILSLARHRLAVSLPYLVSSCLEHVLPCMWKIHMDRHASGALSGKIYHKIGFPSISMLFVLVVPHW